MRYSFLIVFMVLLMHTLSCDSGMVYDRYESTDQGVWNWNAAMEFEADISDTVSMHNIYLQLRYTVDDPLSNLYMFVHVKGPSGQHLTDTINMILAEPGGQWTGKGNGNIRELMFLYRKQTQFRIPGTYVFTLEQAMRQEELPVTNLGVRIERCNP
ncbi:MAG: gliding motility lipoprotein GldH [Anaerolineales bacterium]|nr:gliding motility lipoprotein GldH [Anaerolineales bacterium]